MKKVLVKVKDSLWFIPSIYSLLGLIFAVVVIFIDQNYVNKHPHIFPDLLLTNVELATTISTVLSTALITMTTFTFSISMVVLTTYTSQFSPRVLPNFITDKKTARVLGVFMGGFIYSIFSLLFMRKSLDNQLVISAFVGVVVAIICLVFFIYFINYVGKSIQVDLLIEKLTKEVEEVGEKFKQLLNRKVLEVVNKESVSFEKMYAYSFKIEAKSTGYVQKIDIEKLIKVATDYNVFISFNERIGEYLTPNTLLLTVYSNQDQLEKDTQERIMNCITLNSVRSSTQDLSYALQKIIEIALRATSSAINDPYTAKHCIRNIGKAMASVLWITEGNIIYKDNQSVPRIFIPILDLRELLYLTFNELDMNGKKNSSTINCVIDALIIMAKEDCSRGNKKAIWEFLQYISSDNLKTLHSYEKQYIEKKIETLHKYTHR
jgi:uncharacterized membrane protein